MNHFNEPNVDVFTSCYRIYMTEKLKLWVLGEIPLRIATVLVSFSLVSPLLWRVLKEGCFRVSSTGWPASLQPAAPGPHRPFSVCLVAG